MTFTSSHNLTDYRYHMCIIYTIDGNTSKFRLAKRPRGKIRPTVTAEVWSVWAMLAQTQVSLIKLIRFEAAYAAGLAGSKQGIVLPHSPDEWSLELQRFLQPFLIPFKFVICPPLVWPLVGLELPNLVGMCGVPPWQSQYMKKSDRIRSGSIEPNFRFLAKRNPCYNLLLKGDIIWITPWTVPLIVHLIVPWIVSWLASLVEKYQGDWLERAECPWQSGANTRAPRRGELDGGRRPPSC